MKTHFTCILALFGCATNKPDTTKHFTLLVDERLNSYVSSFILDCNQYLTPSECSPPIHLTVSVSPLPEDIYGQCSIYENSPKRVIEIRPDVVTGYNVWSVVYHELYHCITNTPHYDNEIDIMNSYEIAENTLQVYASWPEYVKKVFLRKDKL